MRSAQEGPCPHLPRGPPLLALTQALAAARDWISLLLCVALEQGRVFAFCVLAMTQSASGTARGQSCVALDALTAGSHGGVQPHRNLRRSQGGRVARAPARGRRGSCNPNGISGPAWRSSGKDWHLFMLGSQLRPSGVSAGPAQGDGVHRSPYCPGRSNKAHVETAVPSPVGTQGGCEVLTEGRTRKHLEPSAGVLEEGRVAGAGKCRVRTARMALWGIPEAPRRSPRNVRRRRPVSTGSRHSA